MAGTGPAFQGRRTKAADQAPGLVNPFLQQFHAASKQRGRLGVNPLEVYRRRLQMHAGSRHALDQPIVHFKCQQAVLLLLEIDALLEQGQRLLFTISRRAARCRIRTRCAKSPVRVNDRQAVDHAFQQSTLHVLQRQIGICVPGLPGTHQVGENTLRKEHRLAAVNQPQNSAATQASLPSPKTAYTVSPSPKPADNEGCMSAVTYTRRSLKTSSAVRHFIPASPR